jgi:hypothetical protein
MAVRDWLCWPPRYGSRPAFLARGVCCGGCLIAMLGATTDNHHETHTVMPRDIVISTSKD